MFSKILVPTDGSDLSVRAIQGAVELAGKLGARLVGLTVVEPTPTQACRSIDPRRLPNTSNGPMRLRGSDLRRWSIWHRREAFRWKQRWCVRFRRLMRSSKRRPVTGVMQFSWPRMGAGVWAPFY